MDAHESLTLRRQDVPSELREGEKVLGKAIISQGIFWKPLVMLMVALFFFTFAPPLGFFLSLVALVMGGFFYVMKHFMMFVVTNQRLLIRSGIIKIDTLQIRLDRIESVEIQRTLMGQFLNYATLVVTGTGSRLAFIPYMENAAQLRNILDEVLYQRDNQKMTTTGSDSN
jgi:uncharacterized membrane protein YdbT with pleckstrin-like domain